MSWDIMVCLFGAVEAVFGLQVGFRWSVKISWRMGILAIEQPDGVVVSVSCPLLSGPVY